MNENTERHLTEETLNDILIGMVSPEAAAHVDDCAECRKKIEGFRADLRIFNQTTLAWSEARSNTAPGIEVARRTRQPVFRSIGWAVTAAALLLAAGVPVWREFQHGAVNTTATVTAPSEDSDAQIAADNELMVQVNAAIQPDDALTLEEMGLAQGTHAGQRQRQ